MLKIIKFIIKGVFSMFNKNSGLVKVWVSLVLNGTYTADQVPNISNLKTVVNEVLVEVGYAQQQA